MLRMIAIVAFFALAVPGLALAKQAKIDTNKGTFAEQRAQVDAALSDGETYSEISAGDRATVVRELDKMEALLAGRSMSQLDESEKAQLMNSQSMINTTLTQAGEDSRMVCRREARVGTRLSSTQCLTVAQRRRQREDSKDALDAHNRGFAPFGEP